MAEAGSGPSWWGIDELARWVGAACWAEHRVFEMTGRWASGAGDPELRVYFSAVSAHRAALMAQWRDRLPVRAGVDVGALVAAPDPAAADAAFLLEGQDEPLLQLGGLVTVVLPRLLSAYAARLTRATPVSEGPVIAVLRQVGWSGGRELAQGRALQEDRLDPGRAGAAGPAGAEKVAEFCGRLERALERLSDKSPDAWAS